VVSVFDLFSESRQHAAQLREFFDAYKSVGFNDEEAMAMVQIVLRAILGLK
jgi:hypothetical protein